MRADPIEATREQWQTRGWDDAADGVEAVLLLLRTHQMLLDQINQALKPQELTFARYEILMVLSFSRVPGLSVRKLADVLQVHSTSVTSAVGGLEEQGLVSRERSRTDRRSVVVQATAEGLERAAEGTRTLNATVFSALGLTPTQGRRLWSVLRSLRQNAGDFT